LRGNEKTGFILRKQHLTLRELSAQTGLPEEEVAQILRQAGADPCLRRDLPVFFRGDKGGLRVCALLPALAVIFFYLPVLKNGFVNWDDKATITDNELIRNLDWNSLWRMWTTFPTGNWMPLTWLSFALDYRIHGLDPRVFHGTNVLLHALNSILVFGVSFRLMERLPEGRMKTFGLPVAFLTALLFGLHPIHVESVAWATERKDVLYSAFYLGAVWIYLGGNFSLPQKGWRPWVCLGLFGLSLTAKPMAVTLPWVLLILDYGPLGRWRLGFTRLLREKTSFFVLSAAGVLLTIASHATSLSYARRGVEFYWVMNAFRSLALYPMKMVWPAGLTAYYPFPKEMAGGFYQFENGCAAGAVLLAFTLLFRYRRRVPSLWAAWLYYAAVLLPVIGVIQTGSEAAADRYTYLASLGFFLPFAAGAARMVSFRWIPYAGLAVLIAAAAGWGTRRQIGTWENSRALWARENEVYPDESSANYSKLGEAYLEAGRFDEALAAYSRASSIPPPLAGAFNGLGTSLLYKNRIREAVQEFQYALSLDPNDTAPRLNLWKVYEHQGLHQEAADQMQEALRIEPRSPELWNDLGVSEVFLKKYGEARRAFEKAHLLDPEDTEYLVNLATVNLWAGRLDKALDWYRRGIARQPHESLYYLRMGDIYITQGLKQQAFRALQRAWSLNHTHPKWLRQIGEDFEKVGRPDLARQCYLRIKTLEGESEPLVSPEKGRLEGMDVEKPDSKGP
jgi:protein O-mannosyl-transferase